jgi:hypothetical protein
MQLGVLPSQLPNWMSIDPSASFAAVMSGVRRNPEPLVVAAEFDLAWG